MNDWFGKWPRAWGLALCTLAWAPQTPGAGGIRTDGSVGASADWLGKPRTLSGSSVTISQEMGSTAGKNLFHSFSEFNVQGGQTVTFTGDSALKNVISRVTGDSASDVAGTLRSTVGKADVYLVNPNGVTFAPGARVDVPAAFHVSTADELKLKDGARFSAKDPGASSLSAAAPAAFGYLGTSAANNGLIQVNGAQLEVKPGHSLDVAAGRIRVENGATLKAEAGEVRLTASRGRREVSVERNGNGQLPLPADMPQEDNAGEIAVHDSSVDAQGNGAGRLSVWGGPVALGNASLAARNTGAKDAGSGKGIAIKVRSIQVDGSEIAADTLDAGSAGKLTIDASGDIVVKRGTVTSSTVPGSESVKITGNAGQVKLVAGGSIHVDGLGTEFDRGVFAIASPDSTGHAGSVDLVANGDVTLRNGALVATDTYGQGNAGTVTVVAGGNLVVDRMGSARTTGILAQAEAGSGDSGSVVITAGNVDIVNGGEIAASTFALGKAGTVALTANGNLSIDGRDSDFFTGLASNANVDSSKDAGRVSVFAKGNVDIRGGGEISSSTFASASGNGGLVSVTADGAVTIDSAGTRFFTGIGTQANPGSLGNAGDIVVRAGTDVAVRNGGKISSGSFAAGDAGSVQVTAGRDLTVSGHGNRGASKIGSETDGAGNAGNVAVVSGNTVSVTDGGVISSTTASAGRAGSVDVHAMRVVVDNGEISAASTGRDSSGQTGNVEVTAAKRLTLRNGGAISIANEAMAAQPGALAPGKLLVTARQVKVKGGTINANASGNVAAGSVQINAANSLTLSNKGTVTSSTSGAGSAGSVSIDTGELRIDRASITARAEAGSGGRTGGIRIDARDSLQLANRARISIENAATGVATESPAVKPGTIRIATPDILMTDSAITTQSGGNLDAGDIRLDFGSRLALRNASITTTANSGNGGSIAIFGGDALQLQNSRISSSVTGQRGDGGDISLAAANLLLETGLIEANATSGNGGNVTLDVQALIASGNQINGRDVSAGDYLDRAATAGDWRPGTFASNIVRAVSQTGIGGSIELTAPQLNLSGAIANLGNPAFDITPLSPQACSSEPGNSLSVTGKGGLPSKRRDWMLY